MILAIQMRRLQIDCLESDEHTAFSILWEYEGNYIFSDCDQLRKVPNSCTRRFDLLREAGDQNGQFSSTVVTPQLSI